MLSCFALEGSKGMRRAITASARPYIPTRWGDGGSSTSFGKDLSSIMQFKLYVSIVGDEGWQSKSSRVAYGGLVRGGVFDDFRANLTT